jgi:hypothetical protein
MHKEITITKKELLIVFLASETFWSYLLHTKVIVYSDQNHD